MGTYERGPSAESANLTSASGPADQADPADIRAVFEAVFACGDRSKHIVDLVTRLTPLLNDDDERAFDFVSNCQLDPTARSYDGAELDFTPELGPEAESLFRGLRATYGLQLGDATAAWNEDPSNWRNISFTPRFELTEDAWRIEFAVERFDGEQFAIGGPPLSFLRIATYLADQLAALPTRYDAYGDEGASQFRAACDALVAVIEEARLAAADLEDAYVPTEQV